MPPSNWLFFDRLREFTRANRIYQQERILQDQSSVDRIAMGGEFLDFSSQSAILEQTNLQINRLERYKDYEQMDQTGEISLALDLYADETSMVDPEHKHSVIIRAEDRQIKEELSELLYETLLMDRMLRPMSRYLCKFGDCPFEIVTDRNRSGVSSMRFMNVYNFTRIETRFGDLVGFFYQDDIYPEPIFLHPWACMHLRLTSLENIYNPYGRAILDGGRKAFKQLRLMEDAALIYRITRAPEKRKFKIPVGMIPAKEVPEYMQAISRIFKRQRFYNPTTGSFDERYSPIVQEDDFFLPQRPDGTGPDIDTLPGAENLDQIADIEYFKKKMVAPLKIPFSRVGIGDGAGESNDKSLSQEDADFAKAVKWVQAELAMGLTKVCIVHLALRGYPVEAMKGFELHLAATSAIEDLYRMETWETRTGVMANLKDLGWFPKEWIVTRFTDLSPDEIQELEEMEEDEAGGAGGMGGGGGPDIDGDLDDMGDMEEPPDDMPEGEGGDVEGEDGGGDEEEDALEGYDYGREKEVILEEKRQRRKSKLKGFLERTRARKDGQMTSMYPSILESNDLDGLTTTDAKGEDEVLVDWSTDKKERQEVIKECRQLLTAAVMVAEEVAEEESEITDDDLPTPT